MRATHPSTALAGLRARTFLSFASHDEREGVDVEFLVALSLSGSPSWWLYGADGELLAWAGQYFASLAFAQKSAMAFKSAASGARYEIYPHADGGWRWRALQYINYYMASSPESFKEAAHARRAARTVAKSAYRATGL
jgi:uncharacterized protein YegP (UPF0339 family)